MAKRWLLVLLLIAVVAIGCASPHIRPDRKARKAFDLIDSLRFGDVTLADPDLIAEFKAIHGRSKWDPVPTTMPGDMVSIYGMANGERLFKLVYGAGWLMDTDDEGRIVRLGILNQSDHQWMDDNIRSKLPPNPSLL